MGGPLQSAQIKKQTKLNLIFILYLKSRYLSVLYNQCLQGYHVAFFLTKIIFQIYQGVTVYIKNGVMVIFF